MGRPFLSEVLGEMNASCLLSMWKRNSSFCLSFCLQTALSSFFQEANVPGHHHQMVSVTKHNGWDTGAPAVGSETQQQGSDLFCSIIIKKV